MSLYKKCNEGPCLWTTHGKAVLSVVNDLLPVNASNKKKRFQAYSCFVRIIHGPLGRGNRVKLPPCFAIPRMHILPETSGSYTGYKE